MCYMYLTCFIFSYAAYLFIMEEEDKQDAHLEVFSHEDSRPTESDINQDSVVYIGYSTFPIHANNQTHCSDDYKIARNIKSEHTPPENMHEYNADIENNHTVEDDIGYGLQRVKCEEEPQ